MWEGWKTASGFAQHFASTVFKCADLADRMHGWVSAWLVKKRGQGTFREETAYYTGSWNPVFALNLRKLRGASAEMKDSALTQEMYIKRLSPHHQELKQGRDAATWDHHVPRTPVGAKEAPPWEAPPPFCLQIRRDAWVPRPCPITGGSPSLLVCQCFAYSFSGCSVSSFDLPCTPPTHPSSHPNASIPCFRKTLWIRHLDENPSSTIYCDLGQIT